MDSAEAKPGGDPRSVRVGNLALMSQPQEIKMIIERKSAISGKVTSRDIECTQEQYDEWVRGGGLIQDLMPNASADDREFCMTGITPDEWDAKFGYDGDDDE